ncbi:hypothetical protein [Herbihabitans rhizosphaerae]|uniref:hypothetical protein n=1 Tax=Herbihabitans rhizosphaerae TaxID=1872711 RepID=UPI00102B9746|nr:hypothetical protein [Herbihabitans rhizosphaerae]
MSSVFARWRIDATVTTAAQAAAAALVTRAVRTTGVMEPRPFHDPVYDRLALIGLRLRLAPHSVFIEVSDVDPRLPEVVDAELAHAADLCSQWACFPPATGGKVVWCEFARSPHLADTGELPRRVPRRTQPPRPPEGLIPDVELMRRVRDSLTALDKTDEWGDEA